MREALLGFGLPEWQAEGLIEDYAHYRRGEAANVSTAVQEVTGHPARSKDSRVITRSFFTINDESRALPRRKESKT
ncbi:MAG TPA: hypothetical protein VFP64_09295 [Pyrinomonadaceae bacterium]|nr:hypothetical protein [Pyrinomonadaceae bacterium]